MSFGFGGAKSNLPFSSVFPSNNRCPSASSTNTAAEATGWPSLSYASTHTRLSWTSAHNATSCAQTATHPANHNAPSPPTTALRIESPLLSMPERRTQEQGQIEQHARHQHDRGARRNRPRARDHQPGHRRDRRQADAQPKELL